MSIKVPSENERERAAFPAGASDGPPDEHAPDDGFVAASKPLDVAGHRGGRSDAPNRCSQVAVASDAAVCGTIKGADRRRLYSATIAYGAGGTDLLAFHASVATEASEIMDRVLVRFGAEMAAKAEIRMGFDPTHVLLTPGIVLLLARAETGPAKDCRSNSTSIWSGEWTRSAS